MPALDANGAPCRCATAAAGGPGGVRHPRRAGRRVRPRQRRRAGLRRRATRRAGRDHAAAGRRRVRRRGIRARRHRDRRAVPGPLRRPPLPHPLRHLPDGSYLARIGYGVLPALLAVRVIDAAVTITLADGTTRTQQWRLLTGLPDPAAELIALYHERWQAETTYYSIKATILDGRVLRSRSLPGTDQETWALLTVYQALIRRHRRHPPRLGHRPDQLHHLAADRRRPGHHRHRHPARRPARPRRPDRPGRPGRPAPRPAPAPHPQEPHHQVRHPTAQPDLHHHRPHHLLRRRTCAPRTTLNATALTAMLKARPPAPGLASRMSTRTTRWSRPGGEPGWAAARARPRSCWPPA